MQFNKIPRRNLHETKLNGVGHTAGAFIVRFRYNDQNVCAVRQTVRHRNLIQLLAQHGAVNHVLVVYILGANRTGLQSVTSIRVHVRYNFVKRQHNSDINRYGHRNGNVNGIRLVVDARAKRNVPLRPERRVKERVDLNRTMVHVTVTRKLDVRVPLSNAGRSVVQLFTGAVTINGTKPGPQRCRQGATTRQPAFDGRRQEEYGRRVHNLTRQPPTRRVHTTITSNNKAYKVISITGRRVDRCLSSGVKG